MKKLLRRFLPPPCGARGIKSARPSTERRHYTRFSEDRIPTNCLIADVRMPFFTGLELAKLALDYGCPSLLISGNELSPEAGGRWDFLMKSFANDVLIHALRGILERPGGQRRSEFRGRPSALLDEKDSEAWKRMLSPHVWS